MNANITVADCREGLRTVSGAALIVADPPYNIGIDYGSGAAADRRSVADYVEWLREWVKAAAAALDDLGSLWAIVGQEYAGDYQIAIRDAGLHWRNTVTWRESFGVYCSKKFARCSRPMFYAVKNPRAFTFNREAFTVESARQRAGDKRANPAGKIMEDVWDVPRVCGTHGERVEGVPTQLPLAIVRRVVSGLTNPGDLVCDPFTGSGTTAVAACESGRRFVGFDISEQFAAIARERVASACGGAA